MSNLAALITEVGIIVGVIVPVTIAIINLINGMKCVLRSEMLRTYYNNKDSEKIHQYELENFVFLYKAYRALKGNSFIEKINEEVMGWEIIR